MENGQITAIISLPIAERVLKRAIKSIEAEGLEGNVSTDVRVALSEVQEAMKAMGIKSREQGESPVVSMPRQSA